MAIYHYSISKLNRAPTIRSPKGRSAVQKAAYITASDIQDQRTGMMHKYIDKTNELVASDTVLPKYAPEEWKDPAVLWNEVEKTEKKITAKLAYDMDAALPIELDRDTQIDLCRRQAEYLADRGFCVTWAMHDKLDGNPHVHYLATTRPVDKTGHFGVKERKEKVLDEQGNPVPLLDKNDKQKYRERIRIADNGGEDKSRELLWKMKRVQRNPLDDPGLYGEIRQHWANICNEKLDLDHQISPDTYEKQGINRPAGVHHGYAGEAIEAMGGLSWKMGEYRFAEEAKIEYEQKSLMNQLRDAYDQIREIITEKISALKDEIRDYVQRHIMDAISNKLDALRTGVEAVEKKYERAQEVTVEQTDYDTLKQMHHDAYDRLKSVDHMREQIDRYRRLTDQVKEAREQISRREQSNTEHPVSGIMLPKTRKENEQIHKSNDMWIRKSEKDIRKWDDARRDLANKIRDEYSAYSGLDTSELKLKDIQSALKEEREDLTDTLRFSQKDMNRMLDRNPMLDKESAQYRHYIEEQNRQAVYQWREVLHDAAQHLDTPEGLNQAQRLIEDLTNHNVSDATRETCRDIERIGQELLDQDRISGIDWLDIVKPYSDRLEDLTEAHTYSLHM